MAGYARTEEPRDATSICEQIILIGVTLLCLSFFAVGGSGADLPSLVAHSPLGSLAIAGPGVLDSFVRYEIMIRKPPTDEPLASKNSVHTLQ